MTDDGLIDIGEYARRMRTARRVQAYATHVGILFTWTAIVVNLVQSQSTDVSLALGGAAVAWIVYWISGGLARVCARRLASVESPLAVPDLLGAYTNPTAEADDRAQLETVRMLARSVRNMRPEDAARLTDNEANLLYNLLDISRAEELAYLQLAILHALQTTGDTRALRYLRRNFSHVYGRPRTGAVIRVEEEARIVLGLLERRKRIEDEAGPLLRPSEVQPELLRPAQSVSGETEALLRPVPMEEHPSYDVELTS